VLDCRSKTENRIRQFLWLATGLPLLDRFRRLPYEGAEQTFQALSLFQDVSDVPQADPAYPAARFQKRSQFVSYAKGMTVTPSGQLSPNWKSLPGDQGVGLALAGDRCGGKS
jgi:hypothetical protein